MSKRWGDIGIGIFKGQEFDLEKFAKFTSQYGTPFVSHTVTKRKGPYGPPDAHIYDVSYGDAGLNLHAESTYNPKTPDFMSLICETPPKKGGRTTVLDGKKFMDEMSPAARRAWEKTTIKWVWPYKHSAPAVIDGAFSNTLLSCFKYKSLEPLIPKDKFPNIGPATNFLKETMDLSHKLQEYIDWGPGDIMVLDNHRWLHGREPYSGERKIYVQSIKA